MKKAIFIILALCLAMMVLLFDESQAITGSFSQKISPNYVVNSEARVYNGWESQTNLFLNFPYDLHAMIMAFRGLEGYGPSRMGNEIQYIAWKRTKFDDSIALDLGLIYHDLNVPPPGLWHKKGDIIKPFAEIGKNFQLNEKNRATISFRLEAPFPAQGDRPEKGAYFYFKAKHDWRINKTINLSQLAWLLKDDGASGRDAIWLGRYAVSLEWEFHKNISLIPAYMLNMPFQSVSKKDGRETFHTPSLAISYKF